MLLLKNYINIFTCARNLDQFLDSFRIFTQENIKKKGEIKIENNNKKYQFPNSLLRILLRENNKNNGEIKIENKKTK